MDDIGAEVSQKIRSAIKAKLMELGAYVDEELPDYIMVMVANKRSREQMEDDLQLFLGSNTEEFTSWLHQVLQKLQEVTVASLERKRKFSTGDGEGENLKKEKRKKSSERKKVRRGGEQTRGKDVRGDSENVNQISGKHKELEKVTKSHLNQSVSHSQVSVKGSVNSSECVSKSHATAEVEQSDIITSLSHKFGTTKSGDSDSESSHIVGLSHRNEGTLKSIEESDALYSGKSGYRKVTLAGKNSTSGKIICSSVEGTQSSVLSPVTNSSSGADAASQGAVHLEPLSRPKIVLMQSDDDDDDEDFINIKADAEAEELLDAELPKGAQETIGSGMKSSTTDLGNKGDSTLTAVAEDKQNTSSVGGLQLSDRLGAKVTTGSVLDRLGVRKVTHESNLPLIRITDRLGHKIIPPETDKHGSRKVISVRSEGVTRHTDSSQEVPTLGGRVVPGNRRSISVISQSERCNISVAQVAPTAVKGTSGLMNVNAETEPLGPRAVHRPLDEDSITGRDQVPRKRPLLSRVVAMRRDAEEEEYDPVNPGVGSLASVICVKPRPIVPAALQANKNLILKAMAEAHKSVASAPKRVEPHERSDGLYTRKFRDNKGSDKIAITLPNRRMQPRKDLPVMEKPSDIERIVIPVKLEASRSISSVNLQQKIVIQVSSDKPAAQETVPPPDILHSKVPEENVTGDVNPDYDDGSTKLLEVTSGVERGMEGKVEAHDDAKRSVVSGSWSKDPPVQVESVSLPEVSRSESPQFVVTLDGLDPSIFHAHSQTKQQTSSVIMNSPNTDSESSAVEYEDSEVNRTEEVQREKRPASPILYQKSSSPDATGGVKQKISERCKYWPACRSGDKCSYSHPTVPCKSFPNCKFGDKCLYIHPNCKFDASCTRRDCPFTHASPRNVSSASPAVPRLAASAGRPPQQVCRFFPKCSNTHCRFLHPKPCRYGRYCSRKTDCSFLHEDIPPADKLKWFCPFKL
ncbi:hypothetical protein B7P43_G02604 [Cryptotermes secundus]|uniref:Zinc finger CCCH domain-containing protein 14 n=1 Tax=Cryptotermes secundus TaxID=105785 RepID=A0A2J7RLU1_9NEOP|nr:zinc finger CCCH domain-containing protein 14 [Cryptotermes secundus]PNF41804.1 hypothetical protein B7P43_G02604 [Cryptotermes secundus]